MKTTLCGFDENALFMYHSAVYLLFAAFSEDTLSCDDILYFCARSHIKSTQVSMPSVEVLRQRS